MDDRAWYDVRPGDLIHVRSPNGLMTYWTRVLHPDDGAHGPGGHWVSHTSDNRIIQRPTGKPYGYKLLGHIPAFYSPGELP